MQPQSFIELTCNENIIEKSGHIFCYSDAGAIFRHASGQWVSVDPTMWNMLSTAWSVDMIATVFIGLAAGFVVGLLIGSST